MPVRRGWSERTGSCTRRLKRHRRIGRRGAGRAARPTHAARRISTRDYVVTSIAQQPGRRQMSGLCLLPSRQRPVGRVPCWLRGG